MACADAASRVCAYHWWSPQHPLSLSDKVRRHTTSAPTNKALDTLRLKLCKTLLEDSYKFLGLNFFAMLAGATITRTKNDSSKTIRTARSAAHKTADHKVL